MSGTETRTHHCSPPTRPTDPELVDRLARLRSILPLLATDLATARRRARELETQNRALATRVAELESKLLGTPGAARSGVPPLSPSPAPAAGGATTASSVG
jgi:hypothetical protein